MMLCVLRVWNRYVFFVCGEGDGEIYGCLELSRQFRSVFYYIMDSSCSSCSSLCSLSLSLPPLPLVCPSLSAFYLFFLYLPLSIYNNNNNNNNVYLIKCPYYLSTYLSIYLSIYTSIYLSIYISIYLSIYRINLNVLLSNSNMYTKVAVKHQSSYLTQTQLQTL